MNKDDTYSYWLYNYRDAVSKQLLTGHRRFRGFGSRPSMLNGAAGEDIWTGAATVIPIPASQGVQCSIVSTSIEDSASGTGIRSIDVHYLDADGNPQEEVVTMAGLNPVNTVATNIRFIQDIHAKTVGSGGTSAGNITIYLTGSASTIYQEILASSNRGLSSMRMVPAGKNFYCVDFCGSATGGKSVKLTLRATAHLEELYTGVFLFQNVTYVQDSTFHHFFDPVLKFPPFTIIKSTAWAVINGADVSANWSGWYENV